MRGLVYAIKDNRTPPNPKQLIDHPPHPSGRAIQVDRTNAVEYVTAMLTTRIAKLTRFFKVDDPRAITLVPVPSSEVTTATIETARFRTLRLFRALAGVGLGTVAVLAAQREPVSAKTTGTRRSADQILEGLARTSVAIPRSTTIMLVDDNAKSMLAAFSAGRGIATATPCTGCAADIDSGPAPDSSNGPMPSNE
jgi:hypothetical protein